MSGCAARGRHFALLIALLTVFFSSSGQTSDAHTDQPETQFFTSANGIDSLGLDLYPSQPESPLHGWGVIHLHGGGFSGGTRNDAHSQQLAQALGSMGVQVISIDYRLRQIGRGFHCDVPIEAKREAILWAAEDLGMAVEHVADRFPAGLVVCGTSAGAEAALHAVFHLGLPGIRGVVSIAGAMEAPGGTEPQVPLLAFHGTCDALVPFCEAVHHHCPADSPGALMLLGGGALAQRMPFVHLIAFEHVGHEISHTQDNIPWIADQITAFVASLHTGSFLPQIQSIPSSEPCSTPHYESLPCY